MSVRRQLLVRGGLLLVVAVVATTGVVGERVALALVDGAVVLACLVSSVLLLGLARRREHGARLWRISAVTFVLLGVGRVLWLVDEVVRGVPPFPGPADVFVVAASALSIVGLLQAPGAPPRGQRLTVVLDGGVVALVALLTFWVALGGAWWDATALPPTAAAIALAYPLLVGGGTSAVVVFLVFYDHRYAPATIAVMLAAMTLLSLGTLLFGGALLTIGVGTATKLASLVLAAGVVLTTVAATMADPVAEPRPKGSAPIVLPLVAMVVAVVVALVAPAVGRLDLPTFVLGSPVFLLLGVRNAITLSEHRDLVASLNDAVAERVEELRAERARFHVLAEHGTDLVSVVGADAEVVWRSPSVERLLATEDAAQLDELLAEDDRDALRRLFEAALDDDGEPVRGEVRLRRRGSEDLVVEMVAVDLTHEPSVGGVVMTGRDVTERRRLTDVLAHEASHDPLTGLANRTLLHERLAEAIEDDRDGGHVHAVVIDLDGFKAINDTMGHAAGDELLVQVASRVRDAVRGQDLVARVGGDEFVALLTGLGAGDVDRVASRVVASLRAAYWLGDDGEAFVHASVGIAAADATTGTVDELLARADTAMYAAKQRGGDRFVHFEPTMGRDDCDRMVTAVALRHAIEDRDLRVVLQPVVDLTTGRTTKVEALARWDHPELGAVSPGVFVPLAEELGLVASMGRLVMDLALRDLRAWVDAVGSDAPVLSVNASSRELGEPAFAGWVLAALTRHGLPGACLELELTERVLVDVSGPTLENLDTLRGMGVRVAVDDFGTGYSTLSTLHQLPVDVLKIDRAFVDQLTGGPEDDESIAAIVVRLARSLALDVVAEGVETAEQAASLRRLGCDYGQGWHFARPAPLATWLEQGEASAA